MSGESAPHTESQISLQPLAGWDEDVENEGSSLPPVDSGKHAWTFLAAAVVLEMMLWGMPHSELPLKDMN